MNETDSKFHLNNFLIVQKQSKILSYRARNFSIQIENLSPSRKVRFHAGIIDSRRCDENGIHSKWQLVLVLICVKSTNWMSQRIVLHKMREQKNKRRNIFHWIINSKAIEEARWYGLIVHDEIKAIDYRFAFFVVGVVAIFANEEIGVNSDNHLLFAS